MRDRPIIQSLWIGDRLSALERLAISSFLSHGHAFHLYVYDEVADVPQGVVTKDAARIVPPDRIFKYRDFESYAGFSNLFRYRLLMEKGEYWVDCDVVCLAPFRRAPDYVFATELQEVRSFRSKRKFAASNSVLKTPPGSGIITYCYEEAARRDPRDLVWGETGPALITTAVEKFGLKGYAARPSTFCPISFWEWERSISGSLASSLKTRTKLAVCRSRGVHLWQEMWRRNGVDKDAFFPDHSLFERLKRRYVRPADRKAAG